MISDEFNSKYGFILKPILNQEQEKNISKL